MQLCSIGELALVLGVAVITLRRWDKAGSLLPVCRTPGGHRRYNLADARNALKIPDLDERRTVAYARVSSHDQSEQLVTQALRLEQHCAAQGYARVDVIQDLGSGMNYKKKGLQRLLLATANPA